MKQLEFSHILIGAQNTKAISKNCLAVSTKIKCICDPTILLQGIHQVIHLREMNAYVHQKTYTRTLSWAWWIAHVVPATWRAEAGGLLGPRSSRPTSTILQDSISKTESSYQLYSKQSKSGNKTMSINNSVFATVKLSIYLILRTTLM